MPKFQLVRCDVSDKWSDIVVQLQYSSWQQTAPEAQIVCPDNDHQWLL
jgi:hypothetical protein